MTLSDDEIFGTGLVRRARKVGVSGFSARERATLVANAFFANRPRGERYAIELQFDDLIHNIAELIGKQEPERTKTAIRTILSDLVFLRDGFQVGKRPRLNRVISLDALHVLLGRLPAALIPPAWAGADFADFGGVGMLAEHVKEDEGEESDEESESEKRAPVWLTSANSLLLPAFVFLMDAKGLPLKVAPLKRAEGPDCLHQLDIAGRVTEGRALLARDIRALSNSHLDELRRRANGSIDWLRSIYSILSDADPLNFSTWQFVAPIATGRILSTACECFARGLDDGDGGQLDAQLSMPAVQTDDIDVHNAALQPIYWHVYAAIRHVARRAGFEGEEFTSRAQAVGLLKPNSEALDRYTMHFVRLFRQVQALYRARIQIEDCLARHGETFEVGDQATVGDDGFVVTVDDFHRLGRWSDYLKALLRFGLVERSRDAGVRLRLPKVEAWEFPSVPFNTPPEAMTRLVVLAARQTVDRTDDEPDAH